MTIRLSISLTRSIGNLLPILGRRSASVGLVIEVREEIVEEYGVRKREVEGPAGIPTVVEEELRRMDEGKTELEQL